MRRKETPTHAVWQAMKQRCKNPKDKGFVNYGARGITYDPKWETFEGFVADMGFRPEIVEGELSLERKHNDGNYCKDNCEWASRTKQNFNQRLRKNNNTGLAGVRFDTRRGKYEATANERTKRRTIYWGTDFFEACCARKSWEAHYLPTL